MKDLIPELIRFRRYLHQHPELSSQEKDTSAYILEATKRCKPDQIIQFENYGLAVIFKGKNPGKNVLVRGDFDALPIQEINDFEYKSEVPGVSHKCGHDGHAAILYGLVCHYHRNRPEKGDVVLLFQPAEENGEGARGIIADKDFNRLNIDFAVALHNLPGFSKHSIIYKRGTFTAAVNSIIIKLRGETSHAGEPELGVNPASAMSEIITEFAALNRPDLRDKDFRLITPVYAKMGEQSYGVSAGYGEVHYTLRAWDNDHMVTIENTCESLARVIAKKHDLEVEIAWTESFFANENNEEVVDAITASAKALHLELEERQTPFRWGEDFGIFTAKFKGAMFGLGAGKRIPALHNPDYDFPDEIIETGMKMMLQIQEELARS